MFKKSFVTPLLGVLLVVAATMWPSPANAQGRRGRVIVSGGFAYSPFFYDP